MPVGTQKLSVSLLQKCNQNKNRAFEPFCLHFVHKQNTRVEKVKIQTTIPLVRFKIKLCRLSRLICLELRINRIFAWLLREKQCWPLYSGVSLCQNNRSRFHVFLITSTSPCNLETEYKSAMWLVWLCVCRRLMLHVTY